MVFFVIAHLLTNCRPPQSLAIHRTCPGEIYETHECVYQWKNMYTYKQPHSNIRCASWISVVIRKVKRNCRLQSPIVGLQRTWQSITSLKISRSGGHLTSNVDLVNRQEEAVFLVEEIYPLTIWDCVFMVNELHWDQPTRVILYWRWTRVCNVIVCCLTRNIILPRQFKCVC